MPITDPEALRFTNEYLRPMCEMCRALQHMAQSAEVQWYAGVDAHFTGAPTETVMDNGNSAGAPIIGSDVTNAMTQFINAFTTSGRTGDYNVQIIEKPCVRPID